MLYVKVFNEIIEAIDKITQSASSGSISLHIFPVSCKPAQI